MSCQYDGWTLQYSCLYCGFMDHECCPTYPGCNESSGCDWSNQCVECGAVDQPCCGSGTCDPGAACGIDNYCRTEVVGWTCPLEWYGDFGCDCGCGVMDVACSDALVGSCLSCSSFGCNSSGVCPGSIDPMNNAVCSE